MVLLTITPIIQSALLSLPPSTFPPPTSVPPKPPQESSSSTSSISNAQDPTLYPPLLDSPISHTQLIHLSRSTSPPTPLSTLLAGTHPYIPPPPPPPQKSPSYENLMHALRAQAEDRAYNALISPSTSLSNPTSSASHAFTSTAAYTPTPTSEADVISEVNAQISLIANVLLSMLCCGGALWMVARWWDTPARLAFSMGGAIVVGVAEVGVYWGYLRRVEEAGGRAGRVKEVREVIGRWEVGGLGGEVGGVDGKGGMSEGVEGVRKRKGKGKGMG